MGGGVAVPEPGTFGLLVLSAIALWRSKAHLAVRRC
ncbi:MAG: PEP-CTERM sorting domain-containing protein [Pseudomonadales bacterium]